MMQIFTENTLGVNLSNLWLFFWGVIHEACGSGQRPRKSHHG